MWPILRFQICFCVGNDMRWVHGSMDPIVGGGLPGLPWTNGNGGRHKSESASRPPCRFWRIDDRQLEI
jgi:hypothetical protein